MHSIRPCDNAHQSPMQRTKRGTGSTGAIRDVAHKMTFGTSLRMTLQGAAFHI